MNRDDRKPLDSGKSRRLQAQNTPSAGEKLQKVLSAAGIGSRRSNETLITEGRVKVNGVTAHLGQRVLHGDEVTVDGKRVNFSAQSQTSCRVLVYNKPEGEVSTRHDPEGRTTVFSRLPPLDQGRWISVGRLDITTTGLILFTNDGELANRLMHPSSNVDREYAVRVLGTVTDDMLSRMREGVELEDGMAKFTDISDAGGEGANHWYHVVLMEGKNREVRRIWESQGIKVSRLKRVRYGCIFLPSRLAQGKWEELRQREVNDLYDLVDLPRKKVMVSREAKLIAKRKMRKAVTGKKPSASSRAGSSRGRNAKH